jgi:Skp family chaperone for outer membrane proteins
MITRIASALVAGLLFRLLRGHGRRASRSGRYRWRCRRRHRGGQPPAIVASSSAYQTAQQQRPVTYKAQIDQANTRKNQITAQLQPLYAKLEADLKKPDQAALRQQYAQIQQIEQAGQREIQQILEPLQLSEQYVIEQIGDKLDDATQSAMTKRKISLVLDRSR